MTSCWNQLSALAHLIISRTSLIKRVWGRGYLRSGLFWMEAQNTGFPAKRVRSRLSYTDWPACWTTVGTEEAFCMSQAGNIQVMENSCSLYGESRNGRLSAQHNWDSKEILKIRRYSSLIKKKKKEVTGKAAKASLTWQRFIKKTERKLELTRRGGQFYRKKVLFINFCYSVLLCCSYANTDSRNKGGSGFRIRQLVLFSLKYWLIPWVNSRSLITFSSICWPGKCFAMCESPREVTEILSFGKTWRTVMWARLWTYNGKPNPGDAGSAGGKWIPSPDCPTQKKYFNTYSPPFQGTTAVFVVYGHGTEKSLILTLLSLF